MLRLRSTSLLLVFFISLTAISKAETAITLILQEDISSKLPTGSTFTAKDSFGKLYHGHVVTRPARRMLRRGSMRLVFDEPVVPTLNEGMYRAGKKMRLLKLAGSVAAAKIADDSVDGVIGGTKARYVGAATSAILLIFQKGGEARLHKGDTVDVEPRRNGVEISGME